MLQSPLSTLQPSLGCLPPFLNVIGKLIDMESQEEAASILSGNSGMVLPGCGEESEAEDDIVLDEADQDDDDDDGFVPSPLVLLQEQIEIDKDDESLRRWKEQLLGAVALDDQRDPDVKFHSLLIVSDALEEISAPLPIDNKTTKDPILFTLAEGSKYQLKLAFTVLHNIVSGLTYSNTVWKGQLQVDQSKGMLGTFAPHKEPYVHDLEEETTPSGLLARGVYSAKLKFEDDDRRTHMELDYKFEIIKKS